MRTNANNAGRGLLAGLCLCLFMLLPVCAIRADVIYVTSESGRTVGEYNAATGAAINAPLISGLGYPVGLAISGNDLYVGSWDNTVGRYDATTGAAINASFITGVSSPFGIALSGNDLYVAIYGRNSIGQYNATTGAPINASLVSGLKGPFGIAVSGNDLFVANYNVGTVGKYNATTGSVINASLISGLVTPTGIAIPKSVPETSTWVMGFLALAAMVILVRHNGRRRLLAGLFVAVCPLADRFCSSGNHLCLKREQRVDWRIRCRHRCRDQLLFGLGVVRPPRHRSFRQ
ncbi:MAG: hypothetical protein WCH98_12620 [Verrucomicrobiota bacterium]